jgi:pimeloyl-ACP methyl ester carboxylesterase
MLEAIVNEIRIFTNNLFKMKKTLFVIIVSIFFCACKQDTDIGKFTAAPFPFELPDGIVDGENVNFGYVTVPELHNKNNGKSMKIAVAIFECENQEEEQEPLILLSGGPGESNIGSFTKLMSIDFGKMLMNKRDVVLIDIRGTYYSIPNLHCPEIFESENNLHKLNMSTDETLEFMLKAVKKAHQRFIDNGINLSAFNNTEIANDIDMIMKALKYKTYNVFGFSAGTLTVQYLLKNHSESLNSAVMTAIVDIKENLAAGSSNTIATMETIFDVCKTDEKYKEAYPDLENRFLSMLDTLNKNPVKIKFEDKGDTIDYNVTGDRLSRWLTSGMYWNGQLPATVNKLINNDFSEVQATIFDATPQPAFCHGIGFSIMASEFINSFSIDFKYNKEYEIFYNGLKTAWHSPQFNLKMSEIWNVKPIEYDNKPIISDVPTLMLCGEYDHVCPPKYAQQLAKGLKDAHIFIFEGMAHTEVAMSPCMPLMLNQFITDPSKAPSDDCLKSLNKEFDLP